MNNKKKGFGRKSNKGIESYGADNSDMSES